MGYGNDDIIQAIGRLDEDVEQLTAISGGSGLFAGPTSDNSQTLAGSNVVIFAANTTRKYLRITAPRGNTNSIWLQLGSAATTAFPSIEIVPGGSEVWQTGFITSDSININGTNGDKVIAKQG